LDSEFLALSLVFLLVGVTGIVLFNGPSIDNGASCACIIPSPEPGAAQGTSSILLFMGILFFPMGLLKGGFPSFGRRGGPVQGPGGRTYSPVQVASGGLFAVGIAMVVVGVDAILVPGYLVFASFTITGIGAAVTALGLVAVYFGLRRKKTD
jgi:hypothetical protein